MGNNDQIIRDMLKKINDLEKELQRVAALTPLYQIWSSNEPTAITTSPQNAYAPGDYGFVAITATTAVLLNGLTGGLDGRLMLIRVSGGSSNITLVHNSGSAATANKIFTYTGANIVLTARQAALLLYDSVGGTTGWLVLMSS